MIQYQQEAFEDLWPDMTFHLQNHWKEVGSFKEHKIDVDYDLFVMMQNAGRLLCCSAREDGKLVGYVVDFIQYHVHYKNVKIANNDAYYIVPEYRAKCGRGLIKFIEKLEKKMEVYSRITRSKSSNNAARFYELMGYDQAEVAWLKRL